MNTELEMIKNLYERSKNTEFPLQPKQGIFNWKCPKCNSKLNRKSYKAPLYSEAIGDSRAIEACGDEFANRVIGDNNLSPGLYNITMNNFTCSCGYEYIGAKVDQVEL